MRLKSIILLLILVTVSLPSLTRAGDVLDRIVATVNGHVILQSDWEDAIRCEAFMDGRSRDQFTLQDRKATLDRLIDQELLREQLSASDFQHAKDNEVGRRLQEIRHLYAGTETEQGWRDTLARNGVNEDELKARIALQLDLMQLVDAKLRPTVNIDSKTIESYYNGELLPQLRQSGEKEVSLAEVTPKIKELLTQQKVNELLTAWLQNLRTGSEISTVPASAEPGAQ